MKTTAKLWIGLIALIVLSPLGLILPEHFKAGGAWGEWGADEMQKLVGYIPKGLEKLSRLWNAPMPGYEFRGSALLGTAVVVIVALFTGKMLSKKGD